MAGTVTAWDTVPLEHGTVAGRPERAGVEEKAQLVAWSTWAERVTLPPRRSATSGRRRSSTRWAWAVPRPG